MVLYFQGSVVLFCFFVPLPGDVILFKAKPNNILMGLCQFRLLVSACEEPSSKLFMQSRD